MTFIPKLRFIVTSDIHYQVDNDVEKDRFEKGMQLAYNYAASTPYPKIDAFFAVGDFSNCGSEEEMRKFKKSLDRVIKPETKITLTTASHECFCPDGVDGAVLRLKQIFGQEPDNYFELGGCPFICLSTDRHCRFSEERKTWLKSCLSKAAAGGKRRPFFVFQHPHLTDTVYGSINWGNDDLLPILTDYPQVIDFSGHSHAPINDPRSIHQKFITSLGTGSISYLELDEFDYMYGTIPPDCHEFSQYYIVEVDAANAVRILPVDILTEQFFHEGYLLNTCWEPESFEFTASRALTEAKPYFPADFSCSYTLSPEHILHITFPQAQTNGYRVNSYTLVLRSSEGDILAQKKISSSYYRTAIPETLSLELPFDYAAGDYTLELFANGFWLTRSEKYIQTISL